MEKTDIQIHTCADTRELAEHSRVLISATQAVDPVYPDDEELLRGKCFVAIGSWRPERRELPDAVWKLVKNAYTELPYACEESGDLKIPLEKGVLTQERVHFIEDLIEDTKQGHPHEQNETRCFKSVGMGLFDVRTAQLIYEKALDKGIGQNLISRKNGWNRKGCITYRALPCGRQYSLFLIVICALIFPAFF